MSMSRDEMIRNCGIAMPSAPKRKRPQAPTATGKQKRGNPERAVQKAILGWLRVVIPECYPFAIENERKAGSSDGFAQARFQQARKANGVVAGMPDLGVILPEGRIAWIEVKAAKGIVSDNQKLVHATLRAKGHVVGVCRSIDDAREFFRQAGIETRENGMRPMAAVLNGITAGQLPF